jgi:hypothetical protein
VGGPARIKAKTSRSYSDRTLKLLWGRAAGRCAMPECRVELFAEATDHDPVVVIGEIAHVAAAADDGPRSAPELDGAQRNGYDNLMLLCQNCHARIDGQTAFYTVTRLQDIKQSHEAWVRAALPECRRSRTGWTALALRGDHPVDLATAAEALSPDFIIDPMQVLQVPTYPDDWQAVDRLIAAEAHRLLAQGDAFDQRIAVFPLAPVSACISLGYHLTSRPHVRLFEHHRDERNWTWPRLPTEDIAVISVDGAPTVAAAVTFLFHFSSIITDDVLAEAGAPLHARIDFRIPEPGTGWLRHQAQLIGAAQEARRAFERALQRFPDAAVWHLFYAGPAPLAVALGQQLNPTMYPNTQLYEYHHTESPRYQPSICLDG